jgi:hypothetical protein
MTRITKTPNSEEVEHGVVLYLPHKDVVETALGVTHRTAQNMSGTLHRTRIEPVVDLTKPREVPHDDFYNHPILVVSRPVSEPDRIHFLVV